MLKVNSQPAFILHSRSFSESSLLWECFTKDYGRIVVMVRGAKRSKSKARGFSTLFTPILISWRGKSDIVTLTNVESNSSYNLVGNNLFSAFYLNELLYKLLRCYDPYPMVYSAYFNAIRALETTVNAQPVLRVFEKKLLREIGYGLQLVKDSNNREIMEDANYHYEHELGFILLDENESISKSKMFSQEKVIGIG